MSLTAHQISAQSVQPLPRYKKGCAGAHVWVHPTDSLCDMHCYLMPKHTPNLVTIARAVPELKLSDQIWHASRGPRYLPACPSNESNQTAINFYWMDLPICEDCVEIGWIVWKIQTFQKRHLPAGRSVAHTQVCPLFKKNLLRAPLVISSKWNKRTFYCTKIQFIKPRKRRSYEWAQLGFNNNCGPSRLSFYTPLSIVCPKISNQMPFQVENTSSAT